jgi:DNA-binding NtrC family response regulator
MSQEVCQNILIVNDEPQLTRLSLEIAAARGVRGVVVRDLAGALQKMDRCAWDLLLVGVDAREEEFRFLRKVRAGFPEMPIVIASDDGSTAAAVRAIREGCRDYLVRPVARETMESLFAEAMPRHDVAIAASEQGDNRCLYRIAGKSAVLLETIRLALKVAPTSVPVLVSGESGTGKELISYMLHHHSHRVRGPYLRVNCAALSETLLESELFGHERGAFTGAYAQRKGKFERAHGGTLLLDEITETGPRLQAELLRVLEQQDFERVGGTEAIRVNVRIVTTTNRDLAGEVEAGRFRRDLYYRISGVHLRVPPLRDRKEDIPVLVWHFVNQFSGEVRRPIARLDDAFGQYHWPGNIRELRNIVRTSLILGEGPVLSLNGLPSVGALQSVEAPRPEMSILCLHDLERQAVLEALRRTKRNQAKAAQLLGITDRTLREKIRRYRQGGFLQIAGETSW